MQSTLALPHEQEMQSPLHMHLVTCLLVVSANSGSVIQTGSHLPSIHSQPNYDGVGNSGSDEATIQTANAMTELFSLRRYIGNPSVILLTLILLFMLVSCLQLSDLFMKKKLSYLFDKLHVVHVEKVHLQWVVFFQNFGSYQTKFFFV